MKPEIKAAWIAALRSGEYKQTRGKLHRSFRMTGDSLVEEYCCLGVLCSVLGYEEEEAAYYNGPNEAPYRRFRISDGQTAIGFLPDEVAEEIGLTKAQMQFLANKNDHYGYTFEQIADLVEGLL